MVFFFQSLVYVYDGDEVWVMFKGLDKADRLESIRDPGIGSTRDEAESVD